MVLDGGVQDGERARGELMLFELGDLVFGELDAGFALEFSVGLLVEGLGCGFLAGCLEGCALDFCGV